MMNAQGNNKLNVSNQNSSDQLIQDDDSDDDNLLGESLAKVEADLSMKNSLLSCDGIQDGGDCIIWSDCDSTIWADADDSIDDGSDILVAEALNETKDKAIINSSQYEDIYDFASSDDEELLTAEEKITAPVSLSSIKSESTGSSRYKTPSKDISSPSLSIESVASSSSDNFKTNLTSTPLHVNRQQQALNDNLIRKRKASEFIKELTSRNSLLVDENSIEYPDSGKKKKKNRHLSAGFAEQLQKLITSQNLEISFWNHRKNSINEKKSVIEVQILTEYSSCGLSITFCSILKYSQVNKTDIDSNFLKSTHIIAIFTGETKGLLKYKIGDHVEIFEPWQRLDISTQEYPVIICTYFSHLSDTGKGLDAHDGSSNGVRTAVDIQKLLNCTRNTLSPDGHRLFQSKDVHCRRLLFNSNSNTPSSIRVEEHKSDNKSDGTSEIHSNKSALTLVATPDDRSLYGSETSLHAAIESKSPFSHNSGITFIGRIQRICSAIIKKPTAVNFQKNLVKNIIHGALHPNQFWQQKWILIVQDVCGTFAEILINGQVSQLNSWHKCLREGEGKCFKFSNMDIVHRTNNQKSPILFSLLKLLSSSGNQRFHDTQNMDSSNYCSNCYVLSARAGETSVTPISTNEEYLYESITACFSLYSYPKISPLYAIMISSEGCQRVSLAVKVLYIRYDDNIDSDIQEISLSNVSFSQMGLYIYVTDNSISVKNAQHVLTKDENSNDCATLQQSLIKSIAMVYVDRSVVLLNSLVRCFDEKRCLLYFKDLCVKKTDMNCSLFADRYSIICKASSEKESDTSHESITIPDNIYHDLLNIDANNLSKLHHGCTIRNLISVEGRILDIEKESLTFYFYCESCRKKNFISNDRDTRRCHKCKPSQISGNLGFVISVSLETEESITESFDIKLMLNSAALTNYISVERLRTNPTQDLSYLKGIEIGPVNCYVQKKLISNHGDRTMFFLEEITLFN